MPRRRVEPLPMPPEAVLAARDALKTVLHSAVVSGLLLQKTFPQRGLSERLSEGIANSALNAAASVARSMLPSSLLPSRRRIEWIDIVAAAREPHRSTGYRFAAAAHGALKRACTRRGGAHVLISETRLFAAYASVAAEPWQRNDRLDFIAALTARLHESEVVVDIRGGAIEAAGGGALQAIFALGVFMAGSVDSADADWAGQFEAAVELAQALAEEIAPAIRDPDRLAGLIEQYKDHL